MSDSTITFRDIPCTQPNRPLISVMRDIDESQDLKATIQSEMRYLLSDLEKLQAKYDREDATCKALIQEFYNTIGKENPYA